jgi:hypothetical protein
MAERLFIFIAIKIKANKRTISVIKIGPIDIIEKPLPKDKVRKR